MFKLITELTPVIAFFIGYKIGGILSATLYMLVVSIISIILIYVKEQTISYMNLISFFLLLISASLTLISGNSSFIKMKPTLLYIMFALIFLVTHFRWTPAIKYVLGATIKLKNMKYWYSLNLRFVYFFIFMACANEILWRNFSELVWVNFKIFGALPLTIVFLITQMPFIMKHKTT